MDYALRNTAFDYKWLEGRAVTITNLHVYIPFQLCVAIDVMLVFVSSVVKN